MKRKVKITFEIEEVTFFKTRKSLTAFCGHCEQSVELLTTENAAEFLGFSECRIFQLIETGQVHFIEADEIYLCRKSLEICAEVLRIYLEKQGKQFSQNGEIQKTKD